MTPSAARPSLAVYLLDEKSGRAKLRFITADVASPLLQLDESRTSATSARGGGATKRPKTASSVSSLPVGDTLCRPSARLCCRTPRSPDHRRSTCANLFSVTTRVQGRWQQHLLLIPPQYYNLCASATLLPSLCGQKTQQYAVMKPRALLSVMAKCTLRALSVYSADVRRIEKFWYSSNIACFQIKTCGGFKPTCSADSLKW